MYFFLPIIVKLRRENEKRQLSLTAPYHHLNFQARNKLENCDQFIDFSPLIPCLNNDLLKFSIIFSEDCFCFQRVND